MLALYVFVSITLISAVALALGSERIIIADFSSGVDTKGVPMGWALKEKCGKAAFKVVKNSRLYALLLKSKDTSFSIQKEIEVDIKQYPILTWKWKVTELPKGGDFRKSKTDDQAAQLFLAFSKVKAIVYIWDTTAPQGLIDDAAAPPFMIIKAVVVRSGSSDVGKWITESRNVYEDYKTIFGEDPPPVAGVRIQINSQHTETAAESYFADVAFEKNDEAMR